jgi:hypothetical protein
MLRWVLAFVLVAGMAGAADVVEEPCAVPMPPPHDNATEYKTKRSPNVYDFLVFIPLSHPSQLPGDILECSLVVGNPVSPVETAIIPNPDPETCWRVDVSGLTWREPVSMWCSSVDATPGPIANTTARFKIQGKPPELH